MEEKILKAALLRAEGAEVYSEQSTVTSLTFQAGRSHGVETKSVTGYGLRVIHNNRIGFSSATSADQPEDLVAAAVETSDFGEQARFELPEARKLPDVKVYNNRLAF